MDTKDFLFLFGVSALFLSKPAIAANPTDGLIPLGDSPATEENERRITPLVLPQSGVSSAPEQSSRVSSSRTPKSEPVQPIDIADNTPVTASSISSGADEIRTDEIVQATSEEAIAPNATDPVSPDLLTQNEVQEPEPGSPDSSMEQVTPVFQLSDVQPSDWAYQALRSLVERYGAISGYPDGTFRGNRALSRYEFAAGLNATLEKIREITASSLIDKVRKEDLETLQKLQTDFATELATLRGRIDNLEARTTFLEAHQFSTTTVLGGEVILGLQTAAGGDPPGRGESNTVLTHLTQLQLLSSFTGKDVLRLGLATGNFANRGFTNFESLNTNMALLSYQADLDNQIELNSLEYRFAGFGDRVVFTLKPVGFSLSSVLSLNTPYSDAGQGAISRFAGGNPVFKIGNLDAGVGFDWLLSNKVRLQFAYGTRNANNGEEGLFKSEHSALGIQLLLKPSSSIITGLAYVNAYSSDGRLDTFTGSNNADVSGGFNEPSQIHAVSATFQWRLNPNITFGTWGGAILTNSLKSDALALTTTYLFSLGFSDPFGRQGDLLAFLVGQPPRLNAGLLIEDVDDGNSLHYEVFYRFRVSDNLSITPGFFIVTDPGHISRNNDIFVGAIRTTFSF
ncbi:iron uptake porin [Coleofasciculus sp. H7-2]|uniref:iron uptake porin n=1 Tax=Coleofasciculus sp. H7-2 TaxID=3351545 RepID=UPI0036701BF7